MRIGFLSDTHNVPSTKWNILPCDIIVHSGDFSFLGKDSEINQFFVDAKKAMKDAGAKHFIIVPGNHEKGVQAGEFIFKEQCKYMGIIPLIHDAVEIEGIKFFGTPYQPFFCNWAYNVSDEQELAEYYAQIPDDTDVLITHCPPKGILDYSPMCGSVGSQELLDRIRQLPDLKYAAWGHIHYSRGTTKIGNTTFINAAIVDDNYNLFQSRRMIVVDYPDK